MKIDFAFAGLNLNIIIQRKRTRKMHVLGIMLVKTRGIKYLNVETWILFAPPIKISGYAPERGRMIATPSNATHMRPVQI